MYFYISHDSRLCASLLISTLQSLQCAWKTLVYFWISAFSFQFAISHIESFTGKGLVLPLNDISFIICVCCIYYAISMSLAVVTIKSIPRITVLIAILYIHHAQGLYQSRAPWVKTITAVKISTTWLMPNIKKAK